jgi:DNA invertase Pin-like site-specific DNA recombinase
MTIKTTAVAYVRVSTSEQGASGLGLEGQAAAIATFAASQGWTVTRTFQDIASGTDDTRKGLAAAVAFAKRSGAVLVVARLDRLSRVAATTLTLIRENRVRSADRPNASELELGIIALLAAEERRLISERTIAALDAAVARGTLLGSHRPGHWTGREHRRLEGGRKGLAKIADARRDARRECFADARRVVDEMPVGTSLAAIAAELNARGLTTSKGGTWHKTSVARMMTATA